MRAIKRDKNNKNNLSKRCSNIDADLATPNNENKARIEGYQLLVLGKILQKFLIKSFLDQLCIIYLMIPKKIN